MPLSLHSLLSLDSYNMSQTVCTPSSLPTSFKFNIQGWNGPGGVRFQIQEYIAITALSGAFYGMDRFFEHWL